MTPKLSLIIKLSFCIGIISFCSISLLKGFNQDSGFKNRLLYFIESAGQEKGNRIDANIKSDGNFPKEPGDLKNFSYIKGDWEKYVIAPEYRLRLDNATGEYYIDEQGKNININSYGSLIFNMTYGSSEFTDDKYRRFDEDTPVSNIIEDGFNFDRELKLHMEGAMGRRMTVYIDHDSRKEDNYYSMKYYGNTQVILYQHSSRNKDSNDYRKLHEKRGI